MQKFITNRIKSIKFTFIGLWRLIKQEESFQVQLGIVVLMTFLGFYFKINTTQWMVQILGLGLILTAEALNTAIEEICNYIQPQYHKHIGLIKDIGAGAVLVTAIIFFVLSLIIYLPKLIY